MTRRRVRCSAGAFRMKCEATVARHSVSNASTQNVRYGFTLIEMLLVMAVMVVLAGLTLPAMARWQRGVEVNQAATELRDELLRQRVLAIREAVSVTFAPEVEGRRYELTVTDSLGAVVDVQTGRLPVGVRFIGNEDMSPIVFRADGTASDAVVELQDSNGDRSTVVVERLTGSVRSREGGAQ